MAETKLKSQSAENYFLANSLSRQAIINGNFDVWQRGTTASLSHAAFNADHWQINHAISVLSSLTRQSMTPGELQGSFYYLRMTSTSSYSSPAAGESVGIRTKVEHGTRYLCGNGKKVTLSFWAKSNIANQKIGYYIAQNYGSGGSPTAEETINGGNTTLTSSWQKITLTVTTNTLSGKTFGTANDDFLFIRLYHVWGSDFSTQFGGGTSGMGTGNIDIAQVQLCAGDVALPFMPKSFEEELRACQRYYTSNTTNLIGTGGIASAVVGVAAGSTTSITASVRFPVDMRTTPSTLTIYSTKDSGPAANTVSPWGAQTETAFTPNMAGSYNRVGISRVVASGTPFSSGAYYWFNYTADAEL